MCGVAAIYAYHYAANPIDRDELARIRDHMAARGPDGQGAWHSADGRVGLAHRRLSIIDLSERGAQPMVSADGRLVISFNGEIYNYKALRAELQAEGAVFVSDSDTEVLLHLYARRGEGMLGVLRGMFAFALWDADKRALLLARDPYGIKPLYYADDGWTVRTASQVKALLAGGKVSSDPEPAGIAGFFLFGSVPEPFTTYQEIRSVPAGGLVWVDEVGPSAPRRWFSLPEVFRDARLGADTDPGEAQERVREAVLDSVRHHLVADVPVGAFLSAGIDSGALVGLATELLDSNGRPQTADRRPIQTVTLAFEEFKGAREDEAPLAQKVAERYGTDHQTRYVSREEFDADIPRILAAMDQPSIDGVNTWFVAKAAAERGLKVVVSGLGGDELFGGYPSFRDVPNWVRRYAIPSRIPLLGRLARAAIVALGASRHGLNPKAPGLLQFGGTYPGAWFVRRGVFMPWELKELMGAEMAHEGLRRLHPLRLVEDAMTPDPGNAFGRVAAMEAGLYMRDQLLRDVDWAGMAHSLEIRVPLVDRALLGRLAGLVGSRALGEGKQLLAMGPQPGLPTEIAARRKTGFGTPVQHWLSQLKPLQAWKRVPTLSRDGCHWSRRWAFTVLELQANV